MFFTQRFLLKICLIFAFSIISVSQVNAGFWDNISNVFSGDSDSDSESSPKSNPVMHVTAKALNVRAQPNTQAKIVGRFIRYQDIYQLTSPNLGWAYVRDRSSQIKGYVSTKYIDQGSGWSAWLRACRATGITRPRNGHVLTKPGYGKHSLVVNNSPGADALVKLKDVSGQTIISMYVRAGQTAKVNVPDGRYQFQYASGKEFSRSCGRFLVDMVASKDPNYQDFVAERRYNGTAYMQQTYTLQRVTGGNFSPRSMNASDF